MKYMFNICLLAVTVALAGCQSDFGIKDTGMEKWILERSQTALSSDDLSFNTRDFLLREGLYDDYTDNPEKTLKLLSKELIDTKDRNLLYALTELTYLHAKESDDEDKAAYYYLSACIYSYSYLFKAHYFTSPPSPFEPEYLFACRFYNYSATEIFKYMQNKKLLTTGNFKLPFLNGEVKFTMPVNNLPRKLDFFKSFKVCYDYTPYGFQSISRQSGLGVPLVGVSKLEVKKHNPDEILDASKVACPATLFIKFKIQSIRNYSAQMEYFDPMKTDYIKIGTHNVPLEVDLSTYLGWILRGGASYNPITVMIDSAAINKVKGLSMLSPYDPQKIPVLFVHGVLSQPRTWVQAINTLLRDPEIRTHYQFWLFAYPTSNPVLISSYELRKNLLKAKKQFDPKNDNLYFKHMIIIAHSMGGLVSKELVTDPGDAFLKTFTNGKPLDSFDMTPEEKEFVKSVLLFKPLPFIDSVVFINTPHRGSYMTRWWVANLAAKLVYLPKEVAHNVYDVQKKIMTKAGLLKKGEKVKLTTGVDNLDPANTFIKVSSKLPIAKGVKYYSIIGNQDKAGVPGGTDGIVDYSSSHLDGAQSEIIVKSGHSAQQNPMAIREIKRILLKHLHEVQKELPLKTKVKDWFKKKK